MNIGAPNQNFYDIFHKIEEMLLVKKSGTAVKTQFKFDLNDVKLTINETVTGIVEMCRNCNSSNHSTNSTFLLRLNLVKNFCELALIGKGHQDDIMTNILCSVLHENEFFDAVMSAPLIAPTTLFTAAETLAFYLCALNSKTSVNIYLSKLCEMIDKNPIFALKILEQLCVHCITYPCEPFREYLCVENGFLHKIVNLKPDFKDAISAPLIMYRVLSKSLSPELCPNSREFLLKNISLLIRQYQTMTQNPLLSDRFWNFLNELVPLPRVTDVTPSVTLSASKTVLTNLMVNTKHTPIPRRKRNFGVLEMGADSSGVSTKTGLCNLNLFLKCINWIFSPSTLDSNELDFIEQNLKLWKELLTRTLGIIGSYDENGVVNSENCLIGLFLDQDDELIIQLLLQLEMYHLLKKWLPGKPTTELGIANPHSLFLQLVSNLSHDPSVLLDWLISNETQFLLYFLRYLKFANSSGSELLNFCKEIDKNSLKDSDKLRESPTLGNVTISGLMLTLSQLKASMLKLDNANLFPYSPGPLLRHLENLELKWEAENKALDSGVL